MFKLRHEQKAAIVRNARVNKWPAVKQQSVLMLNYDQWRGMDYGSMSALHSAGDEAVRQYVS